MRECSDYTEPQTDDAELSEECERHMVGSGYLKEATHGQVKVFIKDAERVEHSCDHSVIRHVYCATRGRGERHPAGIVRSKQRIQFVGKHTRESHFIPTWGGEGSVRVI
jgi:hypothetical protein